MLHTFELLWRTRLVSSNWTKGRNSERDKSSFHKLIVLQWSESEWDEVRLIVDPPERRVRAGRLDGTKQPRDRLVRVDQARASRHVGAHVAGVEQDDGRPALQVVPKRLGADVERGLGHAIRVRASRGVVLHRAHFARHERVHGQRARRHGRLDRSLEQRCHRLCDEQRADRVRLEGCHERLPPYLPSRLSRPVDACVVHHVREWVVGARKLLDRGDSRGDRRVITYVKSDGMQPLCSVPGRGCRCESWWQFLWFAMRRVHRRPALEAL
mmetsp:Transcript_3701/g.9613  ORF Transcript_3701/g.9613 Transcript_3701/m.9613 type:complete len:269 (-) Transcript_3701:136-942(-)